MDRAAFEAELHRDGYQPVTVAMPPRKLNPDHAHEFDARVLLVEGAMTVTRDGVATTYRAGESFEMPAGCRHSEASGEQGATYVAGRRQPAA